MKKEKQINIKLTDQEFEVAQILKKKYATNISQLIKNILIETLKRLEKQS